MKNKSLLKSIILIVSICLAIFALSACSISDFVALEEAPDYIVGTSINESGELIVEYSNGETENLGVVVGADGKDGTNGIDGVDGKDGKDGKDGINGADGKDGAIIIQGGEESTDSLAQVVASVIQSTVLIQSEYISAATGLLSYSSGAGVIYSCNKAQGEALIVTNYHVVFNENATTDNKICETLKVYLYGSVVSNMGIEASFVGGSVQYDLAVLKISNSDIIKNSEVSAVNIKDSKLVHAGDTAIAIGNPKADGFSVTSGIVSVDSENIDITISEEFGEATMRVMRIDTAVNSGNSGGGLFDRNGYLIGIVNAKSIESNVDNIGYAIPSSTMVAIVENIIDYCLNTDCETLQKVLLGINVQILNPYSKYNPETGYVDLYEESTVVGIPDPLTSVAYGKLMVGDKIKKVTISGSRDISSEIVRQYYLLDILLYARVGDTVTITVDRNGVELDVEIVITESCIVSC